MKKLILGIVGSLMLLVPSIASAHTVTGATLSCNQLDINYTAFSAGRENFVLAFTDKGATVSTKTVQTNGPSGTITVSPPDVPQGDTLAVHGTWTYDGGGSFDASAIMYCSHDAGPAGPQGPAGPAGPTGPQGPTGNTGPQGPTGGVGVPGPQGPSGYNGSNGSSGLPGSPGSSGVGTPGSQGPAGPTGAPGPQGSQGVPGTPGGPGKTIKITIIKCPPHSHRHLCAPVHTGQFHVTLNPQGIPHGTAYYNAKAPSSALVTKIVTTIEGNGHTWTHTSNSSSVYLPLNVANKSVWGVNPRCGCTYGVHKVVTTFYLKCGKKVVVVTSYFNDDPLLKRK